MNNKTLCPSLLLCLSLLAPLSCLGETAAAPYPLAHPPRLADYLPPPPAADSAAAVADLGAVLEAQRLRTPEQVRRVRAHDQWEDNVFPFAGDLLGASFDKERLPLTRSFFNRAQENLVEVLMPAKKHFARPRPYEVTPKVKPVLPPPEGESYPSGHTMDSYFKASLLSMLVPEHHDAFFARAEEHAQSRVLAACTSPATWKAGRPPPRRWWRACWPIRRWPPTSPRCARSCAARWGCRNSSRGRETARRLRPPRVAPGPVPPASRSSPWPLPKAGSRCG